MTSIFPEPILPSLLPMSLQDFSRAAHYLQFCDIAFQGWEAISILGGMKGAYISGNIHP
jgi:hypothetical protein